MHYILENLFPILAATVAGFLGGLSLRIGSSRLLPRTPADARLSAVRIALILLAQGWLASILAGALILAPSEAGAWTMAIGSAVVIWIGFVVPATVVNHLTRDLPSGAMLLDVVYWLVVMVVQAAVMKAIGVVAPSA